MADEPRPIPDPINGTEQRLDAIHHELKGLRQDMQRAFPPTAEPDGDAEELRGVAQPPRRKRGA